VGKKDETGAERKEVEEKVRRKEDLRSHTL
jgi:hypothetical protein